ncbi:efflux RND transporter periplasmic adaptor subunit [Carboxylicivirga linearis]|uniref:Efflux RND transporter periplasmic adaptor subunit n=1 Tax=Carboxylicivirga linearis TaxID=1628157 RepID=A0ABS5JRX6_9BACT|nr:efflux RND transporter periplasmic adaptor subunit [Carboxylicivirga linearis]MBS2097653.1 efflux RND transporter periplasmic adaptor subunit [Carboxylicivirga linearis]
MKQPPKVALPQKAIRGIHTITANYKDLPGTIETSGRITAFDEIIISSEVSGRLAKGDKLFKNGASFQKGELIVVVKNEEFIFQLQASRSQFMQNVAASLADIKIDFPESYDKWFSFFEKIHSHQNLPSLPEITNSKERVFLAAKSILNDYYTIQSNEARLMKHYIRAPFNGTLKLVNLEVGSAINPGTQLATFTRTDLFELEVPIASENIDIIKPGMKVQIKNKKGELFWTGTVNRIAEVMNAATQSVSVYISIPSTFDHPLYDGMYLSAHIEGKAINQVIGIPRDAIFNGNYVHVLEAKKLKAKAIEKVFYNNETVYIKGIPEGSEVVTEPIMGITDYLEFESIK